MPTIMKSIIRGASFESADWGGGGGLGMDLRPHTMIASAAAVGDEGYEAEGALSTV